MDPRYNAALGQVMGQFVTFDAGLSELVMQKAATEHLHRHAVAQGAITLRSDSIQKVLHGLTTLEEAVRITANEL